MDLTLTKITIGQQTFWLGSTTKGLAFVGSANGPDDEWQQFYPDANTHFDDTANQMTAQALTTYLNGQKTEFDLPLDLTHGTTFQQQVWGGLRQIPYSQTWTYTTLAERLNRPTATRAIASAVGRNPILIIVPCHRVIRKDGQLGGYRGGLAMKRQLLRLEHA
ncbi:methylated-DNA--[protein]-cysteine S-methyltransferase [Lactiplantibacillus daoliensis]|uniref:Methylated-DNA--[protein]-cysteine S-methyltransferase n=1 Tax=Lactiplantibacillus daoliensis TaxID=2559916 RepID=A0ABW1UHF8_9LACO|nr:methylated-DNA--[protein]-cysteine S-methyltransferase [Lactiplantibacillus daoliensis]